MPVVDEGSVVNWVQGAAALEGLVRVCVCCQRGRNVGSVYQKGFLEHFGFLQTHNLIFHCGMETQRTLNLIESIFNLTM